MRIFQSPSFLRFAKKLDKKFKAELDKQIKTIISDPLVGEQKKGDLREIRVHKFKHANCLYLIADLAKDDEIDLVMMSTHENFYRDLKNYIKK